MNAAKLGKLSPVFWNQLLDEGMERAADRELFGLDPKAKAKNQTAEEERVGLHIQKQVCPQKSQRPMEALARQ